MSPDVKLCMQCLHHPASTRLVGVPCRLLMLPLAQARANCRGLLWEQGHETPIAKKWMRRPALSLTLYNGVTRRSVDPERAEDVGVG